MSRLDASLLGWLATSAFVLGLGLTPATAQEWTRFRGPNGTGTSDAETIPTTWTRDQERFRVSLPGYGHSSPVLWGDRLFLTSASNETAERHVLCLNALTGQILWDRSFASKVHPKHLRNSFATSTPACDAERVYTIWSTPDAYLVRTYDHAGALVWERNLGPWEGEHSSGVSPIVYGELLIVPHEQGESRPAGEPRPSAIVALDRKTGAIRWQTPRKTAVAAYSTPCVYELAPGREELIFNGEAHGIYALDPASGRVNWELSVFDKRSVSSPVIAGGMIFGSCGSGGGGNFVVAVRPGASGKPAELAYKITQQAPYVPTPVVADDLVFLWNDKGFVNCVQVADGKSIWLERTGSNFSGSPVRVRDRLYCISEEGDVFVLAAGRKYELLARVPLGEESRSTPTVALGRMYLRTVSQLICIGGPSTAAE